MKLCAKCKVEKDFENFADALSNTTGLTDETIKENAALAKTFGLTNDEAKKLIKIAENRFNYKKLYFYY